MDYKNTIIDFGKLLSAIVFIGYTLGTLYTQYQKIDVLEERVAALEFRANANDVNISSHAYSLAWLIESARLQDKTAPNSPDVRILIQK
jgi:hypothetical protein